MAGEEIIEKRLERIANAGLLSQSQCDEFRQLESYMASGERPDGLESFHKTNDLYLPLLGKVLEAMAKLNEPHAAEKHRIFMEEKGTMAPAVFLTPWDMTLRYLDRHVGNIDVVARFYGL